MTASPRPGRLAAEKNAPLSGLCLGDDARGESFRALPAFLRDVRAHGVPDRAGLPRRKNAGTILDRCGLRPLFDAVVDGTGVTHPKPDPEVFARGAGAVGARPETAWCSRDAAAGIEAAARRHALGRCRRQPPSARGASMQLKGFEGFTFEMLCREID